MVVWIKLLFRVADPLRVPEVPIGAVHLIHHVTYGQPVCDVNQGILHEVESLDQLAELTRQLPILPRKGRLLWLILVLIWLIEQVIQT